MLKQLSEPEIRLEMEATLPDLLPQAKLDEYCITREQEKNIRKLVVGLERLLPTHEDIFDMQHYTGEYPGEDEDTAERRAIDATMEHPCGSPACAVGYGPSCGVPFGSTTRNFYLYSVEKFGGDNVTDDDILNVRTVSDFMFGGSWAFKPNQMREAIARIKMTLAGKVPDYFDYTEIYT